VDRAFGLTVDIAVRNGVTLLSHRFASWPNRIGSFFDLGLNHGEHGEHGGHGGKRRYRKAERAGSTSNVQVKERAGRLRHGARVLVAPLMCLVLVRHFASASVNFDDEDEDEDEDAEWS